MSSSVGDLPVYLAVLIFVGGAFGLVVAFFVPNPYSLTLPVVAVASAVLYFVTRYETVAVPDIGVSVRLLGGLYFLALAGAILLYRTGGGRRTLLVHLALLVCYLIAAIVIFTPARTALKAAPILLTAVVQRALAYYSSPLYLGNDVFAHNRLAKEIAATGTMEPLVTSRYFYAPFYHLLVAVYQHVAGVSIRHAAFLTMTVALVGIPAGALYLITGHVWGERTALVSVLLFLGSDFALHWGLTPQVTSLGVAMFSLVFLLLVLYVRTEAERYHLLYVAAFVGVALTHQLSTAVTFLIVTIFVSVWAVFEPAFRRRALWLVGVSFGIVLVDFQITRFGGPTSESESFLVTVLRIWQTSIQEATLPGSASTMPSDIALTLSGSSALSISHVVGTSLLVGLAILGVLHWLSNRMVSETMALALGSIVGILFPIVLLGPVVDLRFLIPWRWFAFLYVPLVILAAPGLLELVDVGLDRFRLPSSGTAGVVVVVVVLVAPYVFFMGGNAIAARDGPPLNDTPGAERYALTEAEYETVDHAATYAPESTTVLGDFMIANNVLERHYRLSNAQTIHMETTSPSTIGVANESILVNRRYMQSGHVKFRYGTETGIGGNPGHLVHGVVPVGQINPSQRSVIYSTGETELVSLTPSADEEE